MIEEVVYETQDGSIFAWEAIGKNDYFCNNSQMARPIMLIFELDRDIVKTKLCRKFHRDLTLLSKVIVYTDGRTDTLTDSRVYSLFEYTKMKMGYRLMI